MEKQTVQKPKQQETENPFFKQMEGYLDQQLIAGKHQIRQLACRSVTIKWVPPEDKARILKRMRVLEERLDLVLKRFETKVFSLALISYKQEIIFKGLEPPSLKIFLNRTDPDESEDVVATLAFDKYLRQILVLYPHTGAPSNLNFPSHLNLPNGPFFSIQETYDQLRLGYQRDLENLEILKNHQNSGLRDIILKNSFISEDYWFSQNDEKMEAIGGEESLKHLNLEQKNAFYQIMGNSLTVVQGPPGTGKTSLIATTVINMVKFLRWRHWKETKPFPEKSINRRKVLVCADSNQGVSSLCLSLVKEIARTDEHIRFNWMISDEAYLKGEYDKSLEKYLIKKFNKRRKKRNISTDDEFDEEQHIRKRKKLERADIIICTLLRAPIIENSIQFYSKKLAEHIRFPYSIVDEASQTTVPRVLGALRKCAEKFVLIGDPKQLGPVMLRNHQIQDEHALKSLLEDLIDERKNHTCFLKTQYRMHPSISQLPNQLFYEGRLVDGERPEDIPALNDSLGQIFENPNKRTIFYDVNGQERYVDSSYHNPAEAQQVMRILRKLIEAGCSEIGIIAMYNTQMTRIKLGVKELMRQKEFFDRFLKIKVGTVDSFQGSEMEFIIVSTVRANPDGKIGFVKKLRRMNVALTRAKHGLFIVGNSITLSSAQGPWKTFVKTYEDQKLVKRIGYHKITRKPGRRRRRGGKYGNFGRK